MSTDADQNTEFSLSEKVLSNMGVIFARTTFVPSLIYNVFMKKVTSRRWYDRIDDLVVLGALPFRHMTQKLVEEEKISAVVSLNEEYELKWLSNMQKEWSDVGVKFLQLSTIDIFDAPSQEKLNKGVEFIKNIGSEMIGSVYVHCKAGRTRSATLVACYLIHKYNYTPEEAIALITQKRSHIWLGWKQKEAIDLFYNNFKNSEFKSNLSNPS